MGIADYYLYSENNLSLFMQMAIKDLLRGRTGQFVTFQQSKAPRKWALRATAQHVAADGMKFHLPNLFSHDKIRAAF